jgi:lysophospholipase L1-like esterase
MSAAPVRRGELVLAAALALVLWLVGAGFATELWVYQHNTLAANGRWVTTKSALERGVNGAGTYALTRKSLSGNHLDLGAWLGFQEVQLREARALTAAEFSFRIAGEAYVVFEYDHRPEGFSALRLGLGPRYASARLDVAPDGRFLAQEPVAGVPLAPGWNRCRIEFGPHATAFLVNGRRVAEDPRAPNTEQRIAFRAGLDPTWIDDVRLEGRRGTLHESFRNTRGWWRTFAVVAAGALALALVVAALVALVGRAGARGPRALFAVAALQLFLAPTSALVYGYDFRWHSRRYQSGSLANERKLMVQTRDKQLLRRRFESEDEVAARVTRRLAEEPAGRRRILFVGSSQTWGAGAMRASEGYVERLAARLEQDFPGHFQCLNVAVCGAYASTQWAAFEAQWARTEPELAVIDLGNNDKDPRAFEQGIERFLAYGREHGVRVVLVLEPNYDRHDNPALRANHALLRALGERYGVPVVDVHAEVARRAGEGFVWWDHVHPTSFGHALLAEILYPRLCESL